MSVSSSQGVGTYNITIVGMCLQLIATQMDIFILMLMSKGYCVSNSNPFSSQLIYSLIILVIVYCSNSFLTVFNIEENEPILYHTVCLVVFILMAVDFTASTLCS